MSFKCKAVLPPQTAFDKSFSEDFNLEERCPKRAQETQNPPSKTFELNWSKQFSMLKYLLSTVESRKK